MSALLVLILILCSVALSIGLARLAVGEMVRLVGSGHLPPRPARQNLPAR